MVLPVSVLPCHVGLWTTPYSLLGANVAPRSGNMHCEVSTAFSVSGRDSPYDLISSLSRSGYACDHWIVLLCLEDSLMESRLQKVQQGGDLRHERLWAMSPSPGMSAAGSKDIFVWKLSWSRLPPTLCVRTMNPGEFCLGKYNFKVKDVKVLAIRDSETHSWTGLSWR